MFLRSGFLPACLLFGAFGTAPLAESLDRPTDNPFIARQSPLETRLAEVRQALRLSSEQEALFADVEGRLRRAAQEREAASVAAAIDRNRDPQLPKDPGAPLRARADRLSRYVDNLRALADAETSFFASLSEEQRRIAEGVLPRDLLGLRDGFRRRARRMDGNG